MVFPASGEYLLARAQSRGEIVINNIMKAIKFFLIIPLFFLGCKDSAKEANSASSKESQSKLTSLPSGGGKANGKVALGAGGGSLNIEGITWDVNLTAGAGGQADEAIIGLSDSQAQELEGALVIPDEIAGIAVKVIGEGAFMGANQVTSVVLPVSTTRIGNAAFYNNSSLENVTIPNGVTHIESAAFYNCTSMEAIVIPASVTNIGARAFADCKNLTSITFLGEPPQLDTESTQFHGTQAWVYYNPDFEGWEKVGERFGNRPIRALSREQLMRRLD